MIPAPAVRIVTTAAPHVGLRAPIDLSNRVLRFAYEDRDDAVDKVTVQLANPDLILLDCHDVLGGASWQVSWGLGGAMTRPRQMTVQNVRGVEVLTVEGHARHMAMDKVVRSRAFHGMTRADVMRQVAAEHGFQGPFARIADTDEPFETIHQVAETDCDRCGPSEALEVLRHQLEQDDPSEAQIGKLVDLITAEEGKVRKARLQALTRTRKVLTPEQRAKVHP